MPLEELLGVVKASGCVIDVKSMLEPEAVRELGLQLWRL